jgi:phosphoribosylanthranilate isomerase
VIRVKICGLTTVADVRVCSAAGADALGFIFAPSPRRVSIDDGQAQQLTWSAEPFVTCVGVFAGNDAGFVRAAIACCRLDVLQFGGQETPGFCGSFGKPTILTARRRAFSSLEREAARAIAVLVDACSPSAAGGTGETVDAETFARIRRESGDARLILAGGLTPSNVTATIGSYKPDAVDVRSGVERAASKDPALVGEFIRRAHGASGVSGPRHAPRNE